MAVASLTYANIKAILRDWGGGGSDDAAVRAQLLATENALGNIYGLCEWPFYTIRSRVTTVGGIRFTPSTAVAAGDTTVTDTSALFGATDGLAGRVFFEEGVAAGQAEIKSNSSTVLTLTQAYAGAGIAVTENCMVAKPSYALPDYFASLKKLSVQGTTTRPGKMSLEEMESVRARDVSFGPVRGYCIATVDTDARAGQDAPRLWLWPNPIGPAINSGDDDDTPQTIMLVYRKYCGWFDATTRVWAAVPAADTDILDYPATPAMKRLLRAALQLEYARALGKVTQALEQAYGSAIAPAMARADEDDEAFRAQAAAIYGGSYNDRDTVDWYGDMSLFSA